MQRYLQIHNLQSPSGFCSTVSPVVAGQDTDPPSACIKNNHVGSDLQKSLHGLFLFNLAL